MMGGMGNQGGGGGGQQPQQQQDNQWQTEAFRHSLVRKLEEAIRDSGNSTDRNAVDLERQVFSRANTKEEYLGYVARLILHVRQQSNGQQGDMIGGAMRQGGGGGGGGGGGQSDFFMP